MGKTIVKYLGHNEGHMISKLEENLGDTDIKNFTVSPLYQIKCSWGSHQQEWPPTTGRDGGAAAQRDAAARRGQDEARAGMVTLSFSCSDSNET